MLVCAGCEFWAALALLVGIVGLVYAVACQLCKETPHCKVCENEACPLASGGLPAEPGLAPKQQENL